MNWDWFNWEAQKKQPVTKGRPAPQQAKVAGGQKDAKEPRNDPKSGELDERVERYVRSMKASYDTTYEGNDFHSKIRRQGDPARAERIRKTADMRNEPDDRYDGEKPAGPGAAPAPAVPVDAPHPAGMTSAADPGSSVEPAMAAQPAPAMQPAPAAPGANRPEPGTGTLSAVTIPPEAGRAEPQPLQAEPAPLERQAEVAEPAPAVQPPAPAAEPPRPAPPVLTEVKVASMAETPAGGAPGTPGSPATAAPADTFERRLEAQKAVVSKDPNDIEQQFRLRMMYLLEGQDEAALAGGEGMNAEVQEIMQAQLRSLISARSSAERDPAAWANRQLEAVEELRRLVRSRADLTIPRVALCSGIEGFGRYEPIESAQFPAGQPRRVLVYIEVDNFSSEQTASGMFRTLFTVRYSLLDPQGKELFSQKDENIEDLARQRRRDFYLTIGPLAIPQTLAPGDYVLRVEVEDVLAGKMNSNSAGFKMVP
jgi:hypothetical protein